MSNKSWLAILGIGGAVLLAALVPLGFTKDTMRRVKVVQTYAHDADAFCQGLVVSDGQVWEGTGQYGKSTLRKVELQTGRVLESVPLTQNYFGEGITLLGGKIYQLTWKEQICLVYDARTLRQIGSFPYDGQGWGLANDGKNLYLSDGSYSIRVINPDTFQVVKRLSVKQGRNKVDQLNELEFVKDELWANIWYQDQIVRISPATGEVLGWIDASKLWPMANRPTKEHVLNGIAYDAATDKIYMTGKNWPSLFEVSVSK